MQFRASVTTLNNRLKDSFISRYRMTAVVIGHLFVEAIMWQLVYIPLMKESLVILLVDLSSTSSRWALYNNIYYD